MKILNALDSINVLARVEALAGGLFRRRAPATVKVDRNTSHWSGSECMTWLKQRGVRCWAGRATSDHFIFYVSPQQRMMAYGLLMGANVPMSEIPAGVKPIAFGRLWMGGDAALPAEPPVQKPAPATDKPGRLADLKREMW